MAAAQYDAPLEETVFFAAGRLDTFLNFLTFSLALWLAAVIVLRLVHGQSWRAGLGALQRFDWSMFVKATLALVLVNLVSTGIDWWRHPGSMRLIEHGWGHAPWLLLGALCVLPQAFSEDYLFKGYLLRAWGAVVPYRVVAVPVCAAAFTALHAGNSDVGSDMQFNLIGFLAMELLAFALVVRTGSLATATGLHWTNNVFVMGVIATVPGQPSNFALVEYAHPLLMAGKSKLSDPYEIVSLLVGVGVLWALLSWQRSPLYLPTAEFALQQPDETKDVLEKQPVPPAQSSA